jgi:hypothetical protein
LEVVGLASFFRAVLQGRSLAGAGGRECACYDFGTLIGVRSHLALGSILSWFDLFLRSLRPEVHGRLKLHRDSHTGIAGVGASGGLPYMTFIMFNNYNY